MRLSRSREPPAPTFPGRTCDRANVARSWDMVWSGSPPGQRAAHPLPGSGLTPLQYQQKVRLEMATSLMRDHRLNA